MGGLLLYAGKDMALAQFDDSRGYELLPVCNFHTPVTLHLFRYSGVVGMPSTYVRSVVCSCALSISELLCRQRGRIYRQVSLLACLSLSSPKTVPAKIQQPCDTTLNRRLRTECPDHCPGHFSLPLSLSRVPVLCLPFCGVRVFRRFFNRTEHSSRTLLVQHPVSDTLISRTDGT